MGVCTYCGDSAGIFRSEHKKCREEHEQKQAENRKQADALDIMVRNAVASHLRGPEELDVVRKLAEEFYRVSGTRPSHCVAAKVAEFMRNEFIAPIKAPEHDTEQRISDLIDAFQIEADKLDNRRTWIRYVMLCAIRDCDEGKFPARANIEGQLPFIMDPGERVAWAFPGSEYLVDKVVRTRTTPLYGGVSLRVMQGVYLHSGAPLGTTQVVEGFVPQDSGLLVITDRSLYFRGQHKSLKIRLRDIVTFKPYNEGFVFCKGTATARDQCFVTCRDEGWFPFILAKIMAERGRELA